MTDDDINPYDIREDWQPPNGAAIAATVLVALGLIVAITFAVFIWWATP